MNKALLYTKEQIKWLKQNIKNKTWIEIETEYNKLFTPKRTIEGLRKKCHELKINPGTPKHFSKGYTPWNKGLSKEEMKKHCTYHSDKIGTISKRCDGVILIKVEERKWIPYTRYVWENTYNEKLKPNDKIIHLDKDKTNNNINNLYKTTLSIMTSVNLGYNNSTNNPEITKTAIMNEKLKRRIL